MICMGSYAWFPMLRHLRLGSDARVRGLGSFASGSGDTSMFLHLHSAQYSTKSNGHKTKICRHQNLQSVEKQANPKHGTTRTNAEKKRHRSAGLEVAALETNKQTNVIPENGLVLCKWNASDSQWKPIHETYLNVLLQNHGGAF